MRRRMADGATGEEGILELKLELEEGDVAVASDEEEDDIAGAASGS